MSESKEPAKGSAEPGEAEDGSLNAFEEHPETPVDQLVGRPVTDLDGPEGEEQERA